MSATPELTLLERLLPGFAARRARARYRAAAWRHAAGDLDRHVGKRRYDAASRSRRTDGWRTSGASAISEVGPALALLRDRSRDLVRNNPWAAKAIRVLDSRTIGTGIVPRPTVPKDAPSAARAAAEELRARWRGWAESTECDAEGRTDFYGMQSQVERCVDEAGEALVRRRWRRTSDGLVVPLQLQLLEPDFLDLTKTGVLSGGNRVIQGVEFDKLGRRAAYWLFREHPGNSLHGFYSRATTPSARVPAQDVLHVFRSERIGQVRGVPRGAPCLLKLRDFDEFDDATLYRQKIANMFVGFTHDIDASVAEDSALEKDPQGRRIDDFEPGTWEDLPPGKEITFSDPPDAMGFADYAKVTLRAVAAGYGITYEALTGDLSGVNFSSGRMGWLEMESDIRSWRRKGLVPQLCQGVWSWFLDAAELAGATDVRVPARWTPPRREMLDPLKEIKALREGVRSGFSSLSETIRSLGYEPDDLLGELAEDLELIDSLGIQLDSDPRKGQAATAGGQGEERAGMKALIRGVLEELIEERELLDDPVRNGHG